jgi:hypothetical protein
MATTKGSAIAAPQIFSSDPLEQIYAKGLDNLDTGGLSYAFLNAARGDRSRQQATYMDALKESNMMASKLAQQEMDTDLLKVLLQTAAEHANAGVLPATIPATGRLYSDRGSPLVNQAGMLSRDLKAAQAEKARADAAHARAGGSGGGVKLEIKHGYAPGGAPQETSETFSGKDAAAVAAAAEARRKAKTDPGPNTGATGGQTTPQIRAQVPGQPGAVALPPGVPGSTVGQGSNARAAGEAKRQAEAKARAEAQATQKKLQQQVP